MVAKMAAINICYDCQQTSREFPIRLPHHNHKERFPFLSTTKKSRQREGYNSNRNHGRIAHELFILEVLDRKQDLKLCAKNEKPIEFKESDIDLHS